ncbi:MAG TPA: VanW family protein [Clostridiaceae bacterium]|jgi:VanW family protein|nr:VanW family protein [Clostridiaceae bacterium]
MKKLCFIFLLAIPLVVLAGCNTVSKNDNNVNQNLQVGRTGSVSNEQSVNENNNTVPENETDQNAVQEPQPTEPPAKSEPVEPVLAEFSTTIKSKASNRLNNIQITCSKLNETTVESGKSFSFCQTVGKATEEKGYKKADVIVDKQVTQALGGGNCQVSSTLYNAILKVSDFKVTERHPHGKKVNYVPEGKDAAVSYGSKDLKFVNNTSNTIKIYASTDNKKVSIKIVSVK